MHRYSAISGRVLFLLALAFLHPAYAQAPDRPLRIIVPASAGGAADIIARELGRRITDLKGRPVVVDNRPGAAGIIGTEALARSPADGTTVGLLPSNHAINPIVMKNLPYDTFRSFSPVAMVAMAPGLLVVNPAQINARDAKAAFDLAKANPGKFNYGSAVPLTAGHRSMEMLKQLSGAEIQHVPYKGGAPALADLLAGHVQFMIGAIPTFLPQVKAGQLRALGVTTSQRFEGLPDVPTIASTGFPGFESVEWYGMFAPAGVPDTVVQQLASDIQEVLRTPDMKRRLIELGAYAAPGGPKEMAKVLNDEYARWTKLSATIKLQVE